MQRMKLDETANGDFQAIDVSARTDREGTQRKNRDDVPQWEVEVLHRPAKEGSDAEVIKIKIAAEKAPEVRPMTPVSFPGLQAFFWEMNGRSGISLSADEVKPLSGSGPGVPTGDQ